MDSDNISVDSSQFESGGSTQLTHQTGGGIYALLSSSATAGGAATTQSERDAWFAEKLRAHVNDCTQQKQLKIVIASWNCNSKVPSRKGDSVSKMYHWMHLKEDPDIIIVGLQEVDMSPEAMLKGQTDAGTRWMTVCERALLENAKSKYVPLCSRQMVGLALIVMVKSNHVKNVRDVRWQQVAVGAMNRIGNKGAISCRFQIYDSSFCFLVCHLDADKHGAEKRNANFHDIRSRMDFNRGESIEKSDYLFWFGDLNYRVSGISVDWARQQVLQGTAATACKALLHHDELTRERNAGRAFFGFEEHEINFLPTYRYDPGTLNLDSSEKRRAPAFCDRILWKGNKKQHVVCKSYNRYELLISDHLPISGLFEATVRSVIDHKMNTLMKQLTLEYNSDEQQRLSLNKTRQRQAQLNLVEIELKTEKLEFKNVKYDVPQDQELTITNKSKVSCAVHFVPSVGMDDVCRPWIKLSKPTFMLLAGQTTTVTVTMHVTRASAPELVDSLQEDGSFHDTLCLQVEGGGDYFVSLTGNYLRSFAHIPANELVCYFKPVRFMPQKEFEQIYNSNTIVKLPIPKELWAMVDYLYKYGMREAELFQRAGNVLEAKLIREKIDLGEPLDDLIVSTHSVLDCLMSYLDQLQTQDPFVQPHWYKKVLECAPNRTAVERTFEEVMSPVHLNMWRYLMAFLRELLLHMDANCLTIETLAQGFANVLLPSPANLPVEQQKHDLQLKMQIIKHFLIEKDNRWLKTEQLFISVI